MSWCECPGYPPVRASRRHCPGSSRRMASARRARSPARGLARDRRRESGIDAAGQADSARAKWVCGRNLARPSPAHSRSPLGGEIVFAMEPRRVQIPPPILSNPLARANMRPAHRKRNCGRRRGGRRCHQPGLPLPAAGCAAAPCAEHVLARVATTQNGEAERFRMACAPAATSVSMGSADSGALPEIAIVPNVFTDADAEAAAMQSRTCGRPPSKYRSSSRRRKWQQGLVEGRPTRPSSSSTALLNSGRPLSASLAWQLPPARLGRRPWRRLFEPASRAVAHETGAQQQVARRYPISASSVETTRSAFSFRARVAPSIMRWALPARSPGLC